MNLIEIKAPSPGESITEVSLASWLVEDGAWVDQDAEIAEIESDKATLMIFAPAAGKLSISVASGTTVEVGAVLGTIDPSVEHSGTLSKPVTPKTGEPSQTPAGSDIPPVTEEGKISITPLARQIARTEHLPSEQLNALGKKKILRRDVIDLLSAEHKQPSSASGRPEERVKMSPLRKKLAERLVSVKNETAMLTTFNEVDMSAIVQLRKQYGEAYHTKYGGKISFISFFALAARLAIEEFPQINASIDGEEIVYYNYADICIAVSTPKGLLAPAIRNVQDLSLPEIDQCIRDFGQRAQTNRISLEELRGGTFTITNGGTFGSLLSTPIINPPQSAILGMHKIQDRPVAADGKVEIHPMMYIALSYDHRLIDGKESVGFMVRVKELLEHPLEMSGGQQKTPEELLGL